MTLAEAKLAIIKLNLIHAGTAGEWATETDSLIWIESNIFDQAGIKSSINTDFGERLAFWVKDQLQAEMDGEMNRTA